VNTTALITHWTMEGARADLDRGFRPSVDILAAVSELSSDPVVEPASAEAQSQPTPLLVKRAGEDDWQPLAVGA
jgi:hypothetical protein